MSDAAASAAPIAAEPVQALAASPAAGEAMPDTRTARVKINGKEKEVAWDELVTNYQLREASDEKFRQAKQLAEEAGMTKKEMQAFLKDPWEFAKKNGLDPYDLAETLLLQKLEYEQMSPDAKARMAAEKRAKELEEDLENRTKSERENAKNAAVAQAVKEIDEEIGEALKASGRKPTPRLIARLAESMLSHLERQDGQRPRAQDVLKNIDHEYMGDISEYLENMPVERLLEVLPQSVRDAIRKADVQRVRSQDPTKGSRRTLDDAPRQAKIKRMTSDNYFKNLDKKFGG